MTAAPLTVLHGAAGVRAAVGHDLGTTEWSEVRVGQLLDFVAATGDTEGVYFAISLSNMLLPEIVQIDGFSMGVNYGTDAVRFEQTPAAGDRVRANARLVEVVDVRDGIQTRMTITVQVETAGQTSAGTDAPADEPQIACVIESLSRWFGEQVEEPIA